MIDQTEREKLYSAFGLFLPEFRAYVVAFLKEPARDSWTKDFEKTLSVEQRRNWERELRKGAKPEDLIDYHHFQAFAENYKDQLKRDFPGKNQSLPTWLREIAQVRHKIAHHNGIEADEAQMTWIHLRRIAKFLGKTELVEQLSVLEIARNETSQTAADNAAAERTVTKNALLEKFVSDAVPAVSVKTKPPSLQTKVGETLDIVNCAKAEFRQMIFDYHVYLCPARGGAYAHKQCRYLGIYWQKRVGAVAAIEAVVDVHSAEQANIYWRNGDCDESEYLAEATRTAIKLRPHDLPLRIFLLKNIHSTGLIKDTPGGMFGSKIYLDVTKLCVADARDLAEQLAGKNYSDFGL